MLNTHHIPEWLVKVWIPTAKRKPKKERMSVTSLISPPRQRTLQIERFDDIQEDVVEHLNFFDGNNLDKAFDFLGPQFPMEFVTQEKLEFLIDSIILVGKPDIVLKDDRGWGIIDNKRCKTGQKHYPERLKGWESQLNIYAYLWEKLKGQKIYWIENHAYYKDYTPVNQTPDYPECGFEIFKQPLWTTEEQENYIRSQLEYHATCPYDCPEEERWGSVAVMGKGKKRALRVLKTREECEAWMKETGRGDYIENRLGLRCRFWCSVKSVCKFSPCCLPKYRSEV